uniref:uncharacterized protein LOC132677294 n=1 Tax=Panthera onca TaxID=9690 RepID=UPI00295310C0
WRGAACDRTPASEGYGPLEACQLLAGLWEVGPALGPGSHQPGVGGRRGPWPCCLSSVESVLVSVYVQLDFSNQTWPLTLSRTLTPPFASASSPPATLAGLGLTTECNVHHDGCTYCACLPGYQWNASVCSRRRPCRSPRSRGPCGCLVFSPPEAGYCQLLPPGEEVWELGNQWAQVKESPCFLLSDPCVSASRPKPSGSRWWEKCQLSWQITALSLGPE